ncbi:hypothetical protein GCM10010501_31680 [Streptomyces libani subsp. rufus]|nr:hypothetical protein GCM10010501_31680 [Streptomyces libani subsp. rufus]
MVVTGLGVGLAAAVLGAVFASSAATTLEDGELPLVADVADALASGQADEVIASAPAGHRKAVADLAHQAFAAGLDHVFLRSALAAAVGAVAVLLLVRPTTASGTGPASDAAGKVSSTAPRTATGGTRTGGGEVACGEQPFSDRSVSSVPRVCSSHPASADVRCLVARRPPAPRSTDPHRFRLTLRHFRLAQSSTWGNRSIWPLAASGTCRACGPRPPTP